MKFPKLSLKIGLAILLILLIMESSYLTLGWPSSPDFDDPPVIEVVTGEQGQYALARFDIKKLAGQSSVLFSEVSKEQNRIEIWQRESWNPLTKQVINRTFHVIYSSEWGPGEFQVFLKSGYGQNICIGTLQASAGLQGVELRWIPQNPE